jgi:hypothetical protein
LPLVPIAAVTVGMLANLAINAASAHGHWPGWLDLIRVHSWLSLVIFVAVLAALTLWAGPRRKSAKRDPRKIADRLALAVKAQWESEMERRRVFNPYALPVQWVAADASLFTPWPIIVKQAHGSPGATTQAAADWAAEPDQLAGGGTSLGDVLDRVPTRRLVILGEPGAGKTILLMRLVLDLLSAQRREDGGPVPVLLPVASWNPAAQDLHSWVVHWLATDPAGLARLTSDAPGTARTLLNAGLIVPVLDGFDEIPDDARGSAIAKINEAIRPCPGLVIAARTEDYRAAVRGDDGMGVLLSGATGIELRPLDASVVAEYLKDAADSPAAAERWDAVLATFRADDPNPVAQALRTPLMVTLARAIYNPRDNEGAEPVEHQPAELLDSALFPTKTAVETYLLDKFIWAAYRPHPDPSHPSRRYPWGYEEARGWLAFLARNQQVRDNGSPDIAWWKLSRAAPGYLVPGTLAASLAIIAAVGYPFVGFGVGVTTGLLIGFATRRLWHSAERGIIRGLAGGLAGGAAAGLIGVATLPAGPENYGLGAYLAGGLGVGIAVAVLGDLAAGLAAGFTGGIATIFFEHAMTFGSLATRISLGSHLANGVGIALAAIFTAELSARREVPAHGLSWSLMWAASGLGCGLIVGLIALVQIGRTAGLVIGIGAPVAGALTGGVAVTVESKPTRATAPGIVLRRDRGAFLRSWLVFGIMLGLVTGVASALSPGPVGHLNGVRFGLEVGLTDVIVPGLGFAFIQALWGTFCIARLWLSIKGQLPWRLMTFLHDAHVNRGVFRQVGAVYQFRHIELQRRLAGWLAESSSRAQAITPSAPLPLPDPEPSHPGTSPP